MAEDTAVVENQVAQEPQEPSYSDVELQAMSMGWRPKDQYQGEEDGFVDAKEFVARQSLFNKIDSQNRKIKELDRTLHMFRQHYEKVEETAYKKAYNELKAQKRMALEDEDTRAVLKIEDQMEQLQQEYEEKKQSQQIDQAATQPGPSPVFMSWVGTNQWYAQDVSMQKVADAIGITYFQSHPQATEQDVLLHVEQEVKKRYPEKFVNPNRQRTSPVDGGSQRGGKTSQFRLPPEHEAIMKRFVESGIMTRDEYIRDYKAQQGE